MEGGPSVVQDILRKQINFLNLGLGLRPVRQSILRHNHLPFKYPLGKFTPSA
jgi:hypothetical protein